MQTEIEELASYVSGHDGEILLLESFPIQFQARGLDAGACDEVRTFAAGRDSVAQVGACREETEPTEGDRPTGTTASAQPRSPAHS